MCVVCVVRVVLLNYSRDTRKEDKDCQASLGCARAGKDFGCYSLDDGDDGAFHNLVEAGPVHREVFLHYPEALTWEDVIEVERLDGELTACEAHGTCEPWRAAVDVLAGEIELLVGASERVLHASKASAVACKVAHIDGGAHDHEAGAGPLAGVAECHGEADVHVKLALVDLVEDYV